MQPVRRWTTPITLLLLCALLGFGAWWGWHNLTKPIGGKAQPCVTVEASVLRSSDVTVRVLNAGNKAGLAGSVAAQLKAKGFKIAGTGNSDEAVDATVVRGSSPEDPEVQLVLGFFPQAVTEGDKREDHVVEVILANDFAGFNADAPLEVAVPGGTVCLPPSQAPA